MRKFVSAIRFSLFVLAALATSSSVEAKTVYQVWDVKFELRSPDGYRKPTLTVNGEYPAPIIYATQGDTIVVNVINNLETEDLAIHWHGIKQFGKPWADGTEGVSQCPILPGRNHTYQFVVDQPGTFLYHPHSGLLRSEGLQSFIIVAAAAGKPEPFVHDYEASILLEDWYHQSHLEQAASLAAKPFRWVGEPQSLLINGIGKFNCSDANATNAGCNDTGPESLYSLTVVYGKTYRIRIGSLTSLSALSFEIEGHDMTVVEADGHYVEPFVVKNLFIYSGETYSVLVNASQDPTRSYWMSSAVVARNRTTPIGLAILTYLNTSNSNSNSATAKKPPTTPPEAARWDDLESRLKQSRAIVARKDHVIEVPKAPDRVILMLNTQNNINGTKKWAMNGVSLKFPDKPYLIALKNGLLKRGVNQTQPPDSYDVKNYDIYSEPKNPNATASSSYYKLKFNSTVDVILQNANVLTGKVSETHPWHLHGHDFWVLGYGLGKYNQSTDQSKLNLVNPIMKYTVPLHGYGWTALRFKADNPGVWLFHCHLDAHFFMGMGVVFEEGIEQVGELPQSIMGCIRTKH
ncbi:unnamed protein product [Cuscuta epithymum]|uniref:L-ascorbate oxidase n=1 Tax=Cuscuta epithymum TaxID=186058 RepID=A0AAV0GFS5_9ASTE|nr:unnamed protein product [Cuscuta epithymum]